MVVADRAGTGPRAAGASLRGNLASRLLREGSRGRRVPSRGVWTPGGRGRGFLVVSADGGHLGSAGRAEGGNRTGKGVWRHPPRGCAQSPDHAPVLVPEPPSPRGRWGVESSQGPCALCQAESRAQCLQRQFPRHRGSGAGGQVPAAKQDWHPTPPAGRVGPGFVAASSPKPARALSDRHQDAVPPAVHRGVCTAFLPGRTDDCVHHAKSPCLPLSRRQETARCMCLRTLRLLAPLRHGQVSSSSRLTCPYRVAVSPSCRGCAGS